MLFKNGYGGSTVVGHSTIHPKVEGSNTGADGRKENKNRHYNTDKSL